MASMWAIVFAAHAQRPDTSSLHTEGNAAAAGEKVLSPTNIKKIRDSINATFTYKTGRVELGKGAVMEVPKGFKYLDPQQSHRLLEEIWGNPKSSGTGTMGMLLPKNLGPASNGCWAFNIEFDDIGYVKDEDADKIDYNDLLKQLQKDMQETNARRLSEGYPPITLIRWAATPYYDKTEKTLHWAKELKFGMEDNDHTLNYNVRILGRKGVLSMNAIGGMDDLVTIKESIPAILKSTTFEKGHAYADFDPKADQIAAWTVGGLVAGKVLAKVGFFAILAKFAKFIILGIGAAGAAVYRFITGRRRKEEEALPQPEGPADGGEPEQPVS